MQSAWMEITRSIWDIMLRWIYEAVYNALADFFTQMSELGTDIFELSWVASAVKLFSLFGWALFAVGLVVSAFDLAVENQTGRGNIKSTALNAIKGFLAVSLFTTVPIELYKFCVNLQNTFAGDLTSLFVEDSSTVGETAVLALSMFNPTVGSTTISLFLLVTVLALGYCVIKVFFANIKRGGILIVQIAVGSLYMFSIPRGYGDGFTQWSKQVIALCLTAFMQNTLLFLGLLTWSDHMLLGLGIMLAANEVPRIAGQFGLDTSVKVNMMSAVHTTTTAINLTKSLAK